MSTEVRTVCPGFRGVTVGLLAAACLLALASSPPATAGTFTALTCHGPSERRGNAGMARRNGYREYKLGADCASGGEGSFGLTMGPDPTSNYKNGYRNTRPIQFRQGQIGSATACRCMPSVGVGIQDDQCAEVIGSWSRAMTPGSASRPPDSRSREVPSSPTVAQATTQPATAGHCPRRPRLRGIRQLQHRPQLTDLRLRRLDQRPGAERHHAHPHRRLPAGHQERIRPARHRSGGQVDCRRIADAQLHRQRRGQRCSLRDADPDSPGRRNALHPHIRLRRTMLI